MSDFDWIQDGINSIVRQSGNDMHADEMQAQYDALAAELAEAKEWIATWKRMEFESTDMVVSLKAERDALRAALEAARALVDKQAEDEGLWFNAVTAPEAYLQAELRKLHAAVEGHTVQPDPAP